MALSSLQNFVILYLNPWHIIKCCRQLDVLNKCCNYNNKIQYDVHVAHEMISSRQLWNQSWIKTYIIVMLLLSNAKFDSFRYVSQVVKYCSEVTYFPVIKMNMLILELCCYWSKWSNAFKFQLAAKERAIILKLNESEKWLLKL